MTRADIIKVHDAIDRENPETYIAAANLMLSTASKGKVMVDSVNAAVTALQTLLAGLLAADKYTEAALLCWGTQLFDPRPRSVQKLWAKLLTCAKLLVLGSGSMGKCLAKGTRILMYDGSIKNVEDVCVGDSVMGDDSRPRQVLTTVKGRDQMIDVIPVRGKPWRCTQDHVLCLKSTMDRLNGSGKSFSSNYAKGRIVERQAKDVMASSQSFKEHFKQYTVGVKFTTKAVPFDPYIYGLWIGDGGVNHPVLHNADQAIVKTWCDYFESLDYRIVTNSNGSDCLAYFARWRNNYPNPFKDFVRSSYQNGEKRILFDYKVNDRATRLKVLAGIIDTDGWSQDSLFCVTTKYAGLAQDIEFLARSLGFAAQTRSSIKRIKSINFEGRYFTVTISGRKLSEIPTLIKSSNPRISDKEPLATSIRLEPAGEGEFFGFSVDGNHRFLLGDFTVTHNSYTGIAFFLLDWVRDPAYTAVKLVSTTAGHAKANTWSTLVMFHNESAIPLPGEVQSNFIGISSDNRHASISIVAIPTGPDSKARLQGFHPIPRPKRHPTFGPMSRVRLFIDEAEDAPAGMWQGVGNMLGNEDLQGSVKVYGATNPKNKASAFAQRAEPPEGWDSMSVDSEEWISRQGWNVLHLDAAKSENVLEKRLVYPGLQTWEGYQNFMRLGPAHADMWTFGRGWYPEARVTYNIFPPYAMANLRGTYTFHSVIANIATLDPAFEEGTTDNAILTAGRYGIAIGFTDFKTGEFYDFKDKPRYVIQAEQQFAIKKQNSVLMAKDVIETCRRLHVTAEWFGCDKTGNAKGLYDILRIEFGDILGWHWGEAATETKILEEDTETAYERYDGLPSEMWFGAALWAEHGYLKIAGVMPTVPLFTQLSTRQYHRVTKKLQRAESKRDYKENNNADSPDEADSLIMLPQLVRQRTSVRAAVLPQSRQDATAPQTRTTDDWIDVNPRSNGSLHSHPAKFVKVR